MSRLNISQQTFRDIIRTGIGTTLGVIGFTQTQGAGKQLQISSTFPMEYQGAVELIVGLLFPAWSVRQRLTANLSGYKKYLDASVLIGTGAFFIITGGIRALGYSTDFVDDTNLSTVPEDKTKQGGVEFGAGSALALMGICKLTCKPVSQQPDLKTPLNQASDPDDESKTDFTYS